MHNSQRVNQPAFPPGSRAPRQDLGVRPGNLPEPLTSFVGRVEEIAAIRAMLCDPGTRLLTLTGPGGVGKTRLAIEAAATVRDHFRDGVWFIPVASLRDPTQLSPAIATRLCITERSGQSRIERLIDHLRERHLLLVLDNFEQLLEAAPTLLAMLTACPRLTLLVTSRAVLRVTGERDFPVSPLGVPDDGQPPAARDYLTYPAVALFVERTRALQPDFSLSLPEMVDVASICRRLDGLPLAIELAAARGNMLAPHALLALLERRLPLLTGGPRDAPPRLRAMRAAIQWSYDLLPETEQVLFQLLSVFAGGFTLDGAGAICEGPDALELLDGVGGLVDNSLVHRVPLEHGHTGETRLAMLETVREFGLGHLAASGLEETARQRHATWCLTIAETFWSKIIQGPVQPGELRRIEAEHDNLRAALGWLRGRGDSERFLRLAAALWPYWYFSTHLSEGRAWLEEALADAHAAPPAVRAQALRGLGMLARLLGDNERAIQALELSLLLMRSVDNPVGLARSLQMLAVVTMNQGDYRRARALYDEASSLFQALPESEKWVALAEHHLGLGTFGEGDLTGAAARLDNAMALSRAQGDPWGVANSMTARALVACAQGDDARAAGLYRESLALWQALGNDEGVAGWLAGAATLGVARDRLVAAARIFGAANRLAEQASVTLYLPEITAHERAKQAIRDAIGAERYARAWDDGHALTIEQALAEALDLVAVTAPPNEVRMEDFGLTPREREVLRLLAKGCTDPEIARELFVSPRTIQTHVAHIRRKLMVSSRTEAAAMALRYALD